MQFKDKPIGVFEGQAVVSVKDKALFHGDEKEGRS